MKKIELIREVMDFVWEKAYESGRDDAYRAHQDNQKARLRREHILGQLEEARRNNDMERVAELEKTE